MGPRKRRGALGASLVLLAAMIPAPAAAADPVVPAATCDARPNDTQKKLAQCVTVEGVREHQAALQAIADANGSTRVSGSPGYDLSVDYAADVLRDAGYAVTIQEFEFQTFISLEPSVFEQVVAAPPAGPFPLPHNIMSYSGSGDVTARSAPRAATSGAARRRTSPGSPPATSR